jgi:hypothetical protein
MGDERGRSRRDVTVALPMIADAEAGRTQSPTIGAVPPTVAGRAWVLVAEDEVTTDLIRRC